MAFWSRWRGLSGRISSVLRVGVAVVLLGWCEWEAPHLSSWISNNKAWGHLLCYWVAVLLHPLLAGRGGEGEGRNGSAFISSEGWLGVLFIQSLWRGVGWMLLQILGLLSWWKGPRHAPATDARNKRRFRPCSAPGATVLFPLLSTGRGGEGEGGSFAVAAGVKQVVVLLHRAHHMVDVLVAMICGVCRSSRCVHGTTTSCVEVFDRVSCRRYAPPGCEVMCSPRAVEGGRSWNLADGGEEPGLDLIFCFFSRVLFVKCQDCFRGLFLVSSWLQFVPTAFVI
jgi:hypothetical protein